MSQEFRSFAEFYPFYLKEHSNRTNRRLHFFGLLAVLGIVVAFAATLNWWLLLGFPAVGYLFAWVGHFMFERNKPATFRHPLYSLRGDLVMFKDMLTGKIKF